MSGTLTCGRRAFTNPPSPAVEAAPSILVGSEHLEIQAVAQP